MVFRSLLGMLLGTLKIPTPHVANSDTRYLQSSSPSDPVTEFWGGVSISTTSTLQGL